MLCMRENELETNSWVWSHTFSIISHLQVLFDGFLLSTILSTRVHKIVQTKCQWKASVDEIRRPTLFEASAIANGFHLIVLKHLRHNFSRNFDDVSNQEYQILSLSEMFIFHIRKRYYDSEMTQLKKICKLDFSALRKRQMKINYKSYIKINPWIYHQCSN